MKTLNVAIISIAGILIVNPTPASLAEYEVTAEDAVHDCGMRLLQAAGKSSTKEVLKLPALYSRASVQKDVEFLQYMMAVIYVESRFHKDAKSPKDAYGLMQMTEIAIIDATRHCNLRPVTVDNMFDSYTNVRYGTCYLRQALQHTGGDWVRALIMYNGGYLQLSKYDRGENIASESSNYVLQVNKALTTCKNESVFAH